MNKRIPIDIFAHADFSGCIRRTKRNPGHAVFATTIENQRRKNPQGTLLLDAGDSFSTSFWGGAPCVNGVSLIGTDVMTLGNHEFDRGKDFLDSCINTASFPILCANIEEKETGELIPGTKPYVLLERQGITIGIVGITTEYTPYMVTASSFMPYKTRSAIEACKRYIPEVRTQGADIVIVLAHVPFYVAENGGVSGELIEILSNIPPVDVIIGGHNPGDYAGIVNNTIVLKGGFAGKSLAHARLWFDRESCQVEERECEVLQTDRNLETLPVYQAYEEKVTSPFSSFFDDVLATTDERWEMRLAYETRIGNFLAGCVKESANTDFAYMNATSAGGCIEKGPVTAEDITGVMWFNDPILTANITGAEIWHLFELVYQPERFGNNASLIFAGLILHIDHTRPAFAKVQAITLSDGTPIDLKRTYTVATSEYMASGGNDTGDIARKLNWTSTDVRMFDAIFASIRAHGGMYVSPEQRIYALGTPENNNAPF